MKLGMENKGSGDPRLDRGDRLEFPGASQSGFAAAASAIGTRNLLIIIITMPLVFLVVVMAIIGFLGDPDEARTAAAPGAVRSTPVAAAEGSDVAGRRAVLPVPAAAEGSAPALALPAGAEIGAMALDGDRLALRVETAEGAMIVIYDLMDDAVVKTIPLTEE